MILQAKNITHLYGNEKALDDVHFEAKRGEFIALVGESGSGKSTLLSILSSLLKPTTGELYFDGTPFNTIQNIDTFRQREVGFIFQFHYLINYLTVKENILLAAHDVDMAHYEALLKQCGIEEIQHKYPDQISGGQRQRSAIVRALINQPKIIFADEPTGNLDSRNSQAIYELFRALCNEGVTLIVATHDTVLASYADTITKVHDGKIL